MATQNDQPGTTTLAALKKVRKRRFIGVTCLVAALILGVLGMGYLGVSNFNTSQTKTTNAVVDGSKAMQAELKAHGFTLVGKVTQNGSKIARYTWGVTALAATIKFGVCDGDVKATAPISQPASVTIQIFDRSGSGRWLSYPIADITFQSLLNNRDNFGQRACFLEEWVRPN